MYIPETFIDQLLSTVNIVEVIQKRRQIERRGGAYMAKCPFHKGGEESNASMKIYEETGTYHCFTCKESGNAITFLRKHDNLDFFDAVELLASYVGMEVPKDNTSSTKNNTININHTASQIFYKQLTETEGKKVVDYLKNRGINGETAKFFNLGYSKQKNSSLEKKLSEKFNRNDLFDSGLFGENDDGKFYDRFRDRLMFPIRNVKGECIAFGGRLLEDKKNQAKYLNSPETKTYKKKYELYGLYETRKIAKRPESIFVVEGYMDVIGLFQHGIKNAVASSGTAFTQEQLRKILNYTNVIYIVFDGDEAGKKASWRTVENAMPLIREDTQIKYIFLNEGEDPDSYIKQNGKESFLNLIKDSVSLSDYFFEVIKSKGDLNSIEGKATVAKFAKPYIKKIQNETLKQAYIQEVSNICDLDFSKLFAENRTRKKTGSLKVEENQNDNVSIVRKSVLGIFISLIQYPELTEMKNFDSIKIESKFSFILNVLDMLKNNSNSPISTLIERIDNEKVRNIFGEALVSELKLSEEDAKIMIVDCLNIILQSESDRELFLKDKYASDNLNPSEKRELQQIILKKDRMSPEEKELIKNLSSL